MTERVHDGKDLPKTALFARVVGGVWLLLLWQAPVLWAGWSTQRVGGGPVAIQSVAVRPWKAGVLVSGAVQRPYGYDYLSDRGYCLRIDVLDADGHLAKRVFTNYLPRPIFANYHGIPGRSTYAAYVHPAPAAGSTIRVAAQRGSAPD